ncbi:hypothetical protein BJ322DRAFT_287382 [Thelephora terrestris]|uniref:Secreted protein n=1 Tax=Thelephora terrestris TaxID=56493 RepID=A0A9P6H7E2_9AGAM|nr:hypothetical protein BJ322DRAFT_287382 [Thelephora terrestris]
MYVSSPAYCLFFVWFLLVFLQYRALHEAVSFILNDCLEPGIVCAPASDRLGRYRDELLPCDPRIEHMSSWVGERHFSS